jgi:segregation and condensation protein A
MREDLYKVKTDIYEGPLEVLLVLIEQRKLLINDISLTQVADDFLEYLQAKEDFPVEETASFVLIASTLLLLKSKSLLPSLELSEEEVESVDELEKRLKLYKQFRDLGNVIQMQFGQNVLLSKSPGTRILDPVFSAHPKITKKSMLERISDALRQLPDKVEPLTEAIIK